MNKIVSIIIVLILSMHILTSCDRENMDFGKESNDYGQVNLASMGLSVNVNATPVSRAETVDPSNYIVGIYNAEDETLVSEWKYSELPEIFQLKVGKYKVIAHAPNVDTALFDEPYCEGSKNFEIQKDQITNLETVNCTLNCIMVTIQYDENFRKLLGDEANIKVTVNNKYSLNFEKDETRAGYFPAEASGNVIDANFIGELDDELDVPINKSFPNINIGSQLIITYTLRDANGDPGTGGVVNPSVEYDVTCDIVELDGSVHPGKEEGIDDFPSGGDKEGTDPTVTSGNKNFDLNTPIDANDYNEEVDGPVVVNLLASRGIKNVIVEITSTDSDFVAAVVELFGATSFDLANPPADEDHKNNLISLGFPVGDEVKTTETVPFNITKFVPLLQVYHGMHQFKITVKDVTNASATATLTLNTK
ncbi:DUF4493 domain-containing protein [uncultured Bacteroides sp.]|uniref:DUF4493 domain-containing protein n=1 Tax=Bacteroides sp. f07 TaxID=3132704 RepID=UPI00280C34A6|nr:DUF4493 domain-containing protein [uncultured Bacteroides sp.]